MSHEAPVAQRPSIPFEDDIFAPEKLGDTPEEKSQAQDLAKTAVFLRPSTVEWNGKTLAAYTARTDSAMQIGRFIVKTQRLNPLIKGLDDSDESKTFVDNLATYYSVAITLMIHSSSEALLAVHTPKKFVELFDSFLGNHSSEEIYGSMETINALMTQAIKASDFEVSSKGTPTPKNS
jgi:hypothetical protein